MFLHNFLQLFKKHLIFHQSILAKATRISRINPISLPAKLLRNYLCKKRSNNV